jgi:hypothetical protein
MDQVSIYRERAAGRDRRQARSASGKAIETRATFARMRVVRPVINALAALMITVIMAVGCGPNWRAAADPSGLARQTSTTSSAMAGLPEVAQPRPTVTAEGSGGAQKAGAWNMFLHGIGNQASKLNPALLVALLGWFVGLRLANSWNLRQKRKELDLETARDFHTIYGQFFAVWKLWANAHFKPHTDKPIDPPPPEDAWREVLRRACDVEGSLESLLVRIVCEKALSDEEIADLGIFRQLFQELRESIRDRCALNWWSSEAEPYAGFKARAARLASLIVADKNPPTKEEAATRLLEITSSAWRDLVAKRTLDHQTAEETLAGIRHRHQKQSSTVH